MRNDEPRSDNREPVMDGRNRYRIPMQIRSLRNVIGRLNEARETYLSRYEYMSVIHSSSRFIILGIIPVIRRAMVSPRWIIINRIVETDDTVEFLRKSISPAGGGTE